jgi:CheY-like chemotaxis protein
MSAVPVKLPPPRAAGGLPPRPGASAGPKAVAKAVVVTRPRILAVDDTPDALRQLRDCLKGLNAECFTCGSGASAVEFLSKEMVDLAIVDVSMPGMDGFEVCRAIKHDPRTADIPVILITGDIRTEDTNRGIEMGAFDYLTKPVDPRECTVRVHAALALKALKDELKVQLMAPEEQRRVQIELTQKMTDFQHGMTTAHWQKRFGQLSASFVDEIHYPIAHALASLRVLMVDDRIKEDVRLRLRLLHDQFQRTDGHLRRLLNISVYSRTPQLLRPAELVADVTQLLHPEFSYHGIMLDQQLDPTVCWWGMRSEISRAVLYLLHNAIEALTERGPVIKRRFEDESEEEPPTEDPNKIGIIMLLVEKSGGNVVIQIRDNGPGIPKDLHEKIWDPYFTTKTPPHTGAGLHLARAIVQAAGGDIVLKSPGPACSTQFSILLPDNVIEEAAPEEAAPVVEAPAEEVAVEEAVHPVSEDAEAPMETAQVSEDEPASQT